MNTAKDLWEIFSVNPHKEAEKILAGIPANPPQLTEADHKEIEDELRHRELVREIEAQRETQAEADRHDW